MVTNSSVVRHPSVAGVTNYQMQVLLLLSQGCKIVTSEGSSYRSWLVDRLGGKVGFLIYNPTVNTLYKLGFLVSYESPNDNSSLSRYILSDKGSRFLNLAPREAMLYNTHILTTKGFFFFG